MPPRTHPSSRLRRPAALVLLATTAWSVGCGGGDAAGGPPGRLIIAGGALDADNAPVWHALLEAREGEGPLCVIPTASGIPRESMIRAAETLERHASDPRHGPDAPRVEGIWLPADEPEAASDPAVAWRLGRCSGFWFVGGVQSRILRTFRPPAGDTPAYETLMRRWREGAPIGGTSAGAAMMSTRSIGGGTSEEALAGGVVRDEDGDGEADGDGVWVLPGMELVPWAVVGQHHLARGRWGRLVVATLDGEPRLGVGIDENTALVVEDGVGTVVGASGVLLVDGREATLGGEPQTARGIRLELLGPGDRVEVATGTVHRVEEGKVPPGPLAPSRPDSLDGPWTPEEIAKDPFGSWGLLRLVQHLAAGMSDEVEMDGGGRALVLRKGADFTGVAFPDATALTGAGVARGLSAGPLILDLAEPRE